MASGTIQVENASGFPLVETATGFPTVTGAGDTCCCPPDDGGGKVCYQSWTITWSCADVAWGAAVAGAKVCLPASTSIAWVLISRTATTCTYRRYVLRGGSCTVNADCSSLSDTATPAAPATHADCCQTCCNASGFCCYSDGSTWKGKFPSLTYTGISADVTSLVAWYNGAIAGTDITTTPHGPCADGTGWTYSVTSGDFSFEWFFGANDWDINSVISAAFHFAMVNPHQDCCRKTGTSWNSYNSGELIPDSTPIEFNIQDNYCCLLNRLHFDTSCDVVAGACDGLCNILP